MSEPVFLDFGHIEEIHQASLEAYGGSPGIRDQGLIESALGSAMNTFFYANGDLFDIAAAYAFHLAQAQAFLMETSGQESVLPYFFCVEME